MAKLCKSCGGIYEPKQSDGTEYYHTCPPITYVLVARAGRSGLVPLSDVRDDDLVTVQRGAERVPVEYGKLIGDDVRLGDVAINRPDGRDERPKIVDVKDGKPVIGIFREGEGTEEIQLALLPDPVLLADAP